ncbi:MAG: WbqC family protein [Porphyromonadaceae bacterium]|nr:WbqC family protein [Porphyromonadaceae bacterium]
MQQMQEQSKIVVLSSLYLAPVEYYAALFRAESALLEVNDHYQKQSYRNRCHIGGANGMLSLSIPVEKPPTEKGSMKDVRIANHGNWQHLHWNAILSAYGSTPYFQYYEDDFRPFYEKKNVFLHDFNEQLRRLVCRLIGIETEIKYTGSYIQQPAEQFADLRETIHPKRTSNYQSAPYYQVFDDKQGFMNNLSIIDLLFNMGNESRLYL